MTTLPHALLRRNMNQRVSLSVQRAFQGRDFSRSANGLSDEKGGVEEPDEVFPRDERPSSAGCSAVITSSISMVLLLGKFQI